MSDDATGEKSGLETHALNRRNILLGGTTLAAASALGTAARVQIAQAQQPSASGRPPNIVVIMGDDIGWFNTLDDPKSSRGARCTRRRY